METVTETSGSQLSKKEHILTNVTDFLASGTNFFHFLRQQSTAVCGNSSFFNWNMFFNQSFISASGNKFFVYWWKLLLKLGGSQFLKTKYFPTSKHQFFRYLQRFWDFFKVEANFPYSGNPFFNKSFMWLVETDFLFSGYSVFWSELFFC